MISDQMNKTLNGQIQAEYHSAYLYLGLHMEFFKMGLVGLAHWMLCQCDEERAHAMKIAHHLMAAGGTVELQDLPATKTIWDCVCAAFKSALDHEEMITKRVHDIMKQAREEGDYGVEQLMYGFIREQLEEETTLRQITARLDLIGDDGNGIVWIDKHLGERKAS